MSTVAEIKTAFVAALNHIDTANTNAPLGTRSFLVTIDTVLPNLELGSQVEGEDRPFLGIREYGYTPGPKAFLESRDTLRIEVIGYPDNTLEPAAMRTQIESMMADVEAALYRDIRLGAGVPGDGVCTFLTLAGRDNDMEKVIARGYFRIAVDIVFHRSLRTGD